MFLILFDNKPNFYMFSLIVDNLDFEFLGWIVSLLSLIVNIVQAKKNSDLKTRIKNLNNITAKEESSVNFTNQENESGDNFSSGRDMTINNSKESQN